MTDLVLHIGLSKCGSTSIQWDLLGHPNYLGRGGEASRYGNRLTRDFLRLSPINRFPSLDSLDRWSEKAYNHISDRCGGPPGTCVLSSEVLSKPKDSSYEPLFDFLERLEREIWHWGKVKVVVVIRAQGPRIGSMYAQNSHRHPKAGQAHFESFVDQCLECDVSLKYYELIVGLSARLGLSNVLALCLEEISSEEFWVDLREFTGCQDCENSESNRLGDSSNKRSATEGTWGVRDPLDPSISRSVANSILLWGWPQSLFPGLRLFSRNVIADIDLRIREFRFRNDVGRSQSIELTQDLHQRIRSFYSVENQRLGLMIGKDLKNLGYL